MQATESCIKIASMCGSYKDLYGLEHKEPQFELAGFPPTRHRTLVFHSPLSFYAFCVLPVQGFSSSSHQKPSVDVLSIIVSICINISVAIIIVSTFSSSTNIIIIISTIIISSSM